MRISDWIRCSGLRQLLAFGLLGVAAIAAGARAESPAAQAPQGVLWEIRSGASTAFLFGSIHVAKAGFYPLAPAVEAAYRRADTLAVEIDMTDQSASAKAASFLTYTPPDTLRKHVSEKTWKSLESRIGPAAAQLQSMRPAVLVAALAIQAASTMGFDPGQGIDLYFTRKAKADGKKVVELESAEFQARILGSLSDADGDAMLAETLHELGSGALNREFAQMAEAWSAGDDAALDSVMQDAANKDEGSRRLMKLLLQDRNVEMARKIGRLIASGDKAFVVIGAGHLVGANSVVQLLARQGLQARRVGGVR